jgi:predicted acyltransferase (DUF342 family)
MSGWLETNNANKFKQSYFRDFVDVSGDILIRNDNSLKLYDNNNPTRVQFSINSNDFRIYKEDNQTYYDISNTSLIHLDNLSENVQDSLNSLTDKSKYISNDVSNSDTLVELNQSQNAVKVYAKLDVSYTIIGHADLSVNQNVVIGNNLSVKNDASFNGNLVVNSDTYLNSKLTVTSDASFNGNLVVNSHTYLNSKLTVTSDASFNGNLVVNSDTYLNSKLTVTSDAAFNGNLVVNSDTYLNSKLTVTSDAAFNGNLVVNSDTYLNSKLSVTSDASFNGNLVVNSDTYLNSKLTVTSDAAFNGNLLVNNNTYINSKLTVNNNALFNGQVDVLGNFYAQYPPNSIPPGAIMGGVVNKLPPTSKLFSFDENGFVTITGVGDEVTLYENTYALMKPSSFGGGSNDITFIDNFVLLKKDINPYAFKSVTIDNLTINSFAIFLGTLFANTPGLVDSSQLVATTAFVKGQNYATPSTLFRQFDLAL